MEKNGMHLKEYLTRPLPPIPPEIAEKLSGSGSVTLTPFERKNDLLTDADLQAEVGFSHFNSGDWLVSMVCPMPGVTPDMVRWWFWWHAKESLRYKIWFPGEHYGISTAKKDAAYFSAASLPAFQPNTHYPVERIGKLILPLKIAFISPGDFGFSPRLMEENDIPLIVCGHVGAGWGLVEHTEMAHIFRRTPDGLLLISRFWLGKRLKNPLIRKAMLTETTARGMAAHCCVEYRNLARILPELYETYGNRPE